MTSPSFERIDYQLRYNKNIERKLIFDVLSRAQQLIGFESHQYLGFRSMWFTDFRLAHRLLGLDRMISMEREEHAPRAKFNSPYRSIRVEGGNSSKTLETIDWSLPVIAWLDYDGALELEVVADIKAVLQKSALNSVLIVTLNAARGSYRPRKDGQRTRIETALGQVEHLLVPGVVPARFEPISRTPSHGDVADRDFPEFISEAVLSYMMHIVASGGGYTATSQNSTHPPSFVPLFNFCHKDGVEMTTVGGVITTNNDTIWREQVAKGIEFSNTNRFPIHQRLDLIPLTLKEKLILDSCLPEPEQTVFVQSAKESGIQLEDCELKKYWNHYRHFPVFFESPV
ncbi:O-methyltransferase [Chitinibacteraceae bacterium HSL-7]